MHEFLFSICWHKISNDRYDRNSMGWGYRSPNPELKHFHFQVHFWPHKKIIIYIHSKKDFTLDTDMNIPLKFTACNKRAKMTKDLIKHSVSSFYCICWIDYLYNNQFDKLLIVMCQDTIWQEVISITYLWFCWIYDY